MIALKLSPRNSSHIFFFSIWTCRVPSTAHRAPFSSPPILLYFSPSPLLGSPQLRGPGAFRPDTHTHTYTRVHKHTPPYTRQRTQQEMPNTSFRMMPLCQLDKEAAGSVTREGNRETERESETESSISPKKVETERKKQLLCPRMLCSSFWVCKTLHFSAHEEHLNMVSLLMEVHFKHRISKHTISTGTAKIDPTTPLSRDPQVKGPSECVNVRLHTHVWLCVWVDAHVFL